jgi:hypothetical protein
LVHVLTGLQRGVGVVLAHLVKLLLVLVHLAHQLANSGRGEAPVSGLELKDFTLLDNNQPGKILSFQAFGGGSQKATPPVEVILLIDTVNEGFQQVSMTRQQIANFLLQNGGHLAAPVSLFVDDQPGRGCPEPAYIRWKWFGPGHQES